MEETWKTPNMQITQILNKSRKLMEIVGPGYKSQLFKQPCFSIWRSKVSQHTSPYLPVSAIVCACARCWMHQPWDYTVAHIPLSHHRPAWARSSAAPTWSNNIQHVPTSWLRFFILHHFTSFHHLSPSPRDVEGFLCKSATEELQTHVEQHQYATLADQVVVIAVLDVEDVGLITPLQPLLPQSIGKNCGHFSKLSTTGPSQQNPLNKI